MILLMVMVMMVLVMIVIDVLVSMDWFMMVYGKIYRKQSIFPLNVGLSCKKETLNHSIDSIDGMFLAMVSTTWQCGSHACHNFLWVRGQRGTQHV